MIADTTAWVEYLRATGSPTNRRLREAIDDGSALVVPEPVAMELLIGSSDDAVAARLREMLHTFEIHPVAPLVDMEEAAAIHRRCRRGGETVRGLLDGVTAAMAIRLDLPVLHQDRDFDVMARHTALRTVDP